jgi:hypothetical protein
VDLLKVYYYENYFLMTCLQMKNLLKIYLLLKSLQMNVLQKIHLMSGLRYFLHFFPIYFPPV